MNRVLAMELELHNNNIAINNLIKRFGPDHPDVIYYKEYNSLRYQIYAKLKILGDV